MVGEEDAGAPAGVDGGGEEVDVGEVGEAGGEASGEEERPEEEAEGVTEAAEEEEPAAADEGGGVVVGGGEEGEDAKEERIWKEEGEIDGRESISEINGWCCFLLKEEDMGFVLEADDWGFF